MGRDEASREIRSGRSESLIYRERPASRAPAGGLVLLHGRGADEYDLWPLLDALDPQRRLVAATPRGPLSLPPGGAHWYRLGALGYPDPETFRPTYERAAAWLDGWVAAHGLDMERVVIGGFSQGAVMAYALALGAGRPAPAGLLAFSGFVPTVEGWEIDLAKAADLPIVVAHGAFDAVIGVEWGRAARDALDGAGARLTYREYPLPHTIDPAFVGSLVRWIEDVVTG